MDHHKSDIALFRYSLIRQAADLSLTKAERGSIIRELSGQTHRHSDGRYVLISRATLDRWLRAYLHGGFEALHPAPKARIPRIDLELLELAITLKQEESTRTAVQVSKLVRTALGRSPSARSLQRHFRRLGLNSAPGARKVYGRFEAAQPNDRSTGDGLHGSVIAGHKAILFAFIDDHSRTLCGYRWLHINGEATFAMCKALRRGLSSRGIPKDVYVDNGSAFSSRQFERA